MHTPRSRERTGPTTRYANQRRPTDTHVATCREKQERTVCSQSGGDREQERQARTTESAESGGALMDGGGSTRVRTHSITGRTEGERPRVTSGVATLSTAVWPTQVKSPDEQAARGCRKGGGNTPALPKSEPTCNESQKMINAETKSQRKEVLASRIQRREQTLDYLGTGDAPCAWKRRLRESGGSRRTTSGKRAATEERRRTRERRGRKRRSQKDAATTREKRRINGERLDCFIAPTQEGSAKVVVSGLVTLGTLLSRFSTPGVSNTARGAFDTGPRS
ncbi:hypothetical protein MRX96_001502 [Rhipicephalus microplus]